MRKNVLITGASGGIGTAMAMAFGEKGYGVALHCHKNREKAEKTAALIEKAGGKARVYQADISDEAQVEAMFSQAEKELGFLSVVINNAAISEKGLFTDITLAQWQNIFAVNVNGVFLCCRRALGPMIREKQGAIINVTSMWGEVGASCESAYAATKAAVIGLTKSLAKEEGLSGIRVNCLSPGVIATKMNGNLSQEDMEALQEETPLNRIGTPEEVAHAALFLAENTFVTGQVLGVNGGFVI